MARSSRRSLLLIFVVIIACGFLGAVFGQRIGSGSTSGDSEIRDSMRVFSSVYDVVEQNYAEPVRDRKSVV